jgi:syntaxin 8
LTQNGLGGGSSGKGKKGESEVEKQMREIGDSYDRLVEMLSEDEGGRVKAKALIREQ